LTSSNNGKPDLKFIHLADTHLGLNWPAIGRRENIQIPVYGNAFASIIDTAIETEVDFIIHAGDLVNRPCPPTAAWNRQLHELPRLKEAEIPFIATVGSHDRPESYFDKAGGDILQLLDKRLSLVNRVDTDDHPWYRFKTKRGVNVSVYGLGDHRQEQEKSLLELSKKMAQEDDFSILLMHGSIISMPQFTGATVKTEMISKLLSQKYVDYVALGHNHQKWEHKDLQIYNPGSPEYTSFSDAPTLYYSYDGATLKKETAKTPGHGFYIVEVTGEIVEAQFKTVPLRDVKNVDIAFKNATVSQVVEATKQAITESLSSSSIIRPILRGTLHPASSRSEIDLQEILTLKSKLLFLDYPLIELNTDKIHLETMEEADIHHILTQYLTAKLGQNAEKPVEITMKLIDLYNKKTRTTPQEVSSLIDEWKPID
jgi:DNA repair exonuclease SbcCD nuclease subunit